MVLLLCELAFLGFTTGAFVTAGPSVITDVLLTALFIVSTLFFYGLQIQRDLVIEKINFMVGYVSTVVFVLANLFTQSASAAAVLGSLSGVVLMVNVLAVHQSRKVRAQETVSVKEMEQLKNTMDTINEDAITEKALVPQSFRTVTPVTEMVSEMQRRNSTNIMNVKIDAPNSDLDAQQLFMQELRIRDTIDKVDDKIDAKHQVTEKRIDDVKQQINATFQDVKEKIEEIKEEKKKLFIASKSGKKVHTPGCMVAERIPEKKRIVIDDFEQAIKKGYSSCGVCCPLDAVTGDGVASK